MMKLFPTNLFSSGQSQSDPSSPSKPNAENAFASLLQEGTIEISRSPINDISMGHAEETREVVSRSDQAAPNSRRKAENRDQTKTRDSQSDGRERESAETQSVDRSRENDRSQTSDDSAKRSAPIERDNERAEGIDRSQEAASAESQSENAPVDQKQSSNPGQSENVTSGEVSHEALAQAAALTNVSDIPTLGLPNLALLAQIEPPGQPITNDYPLIGATLLSPAALGGIEGWETAALSPQMSNSKPLSDVPTDVLKALGSINQGESSIASAALQSTSGPIGPELMKSLGKNPLLQAAKAFQPESSPLEQTQQAASLSTTTQSVQSAVQNLNQTGQSLLGGSLFQELTQKGVQGPFNNNGSNDSTLGDAEGTPIAELPEAFQQAKAVWTNVDPRPTVLENHTKTLSQMHGYAAEEQEAEGDSDTLSTKKPTAPLAGLNTNGRAAIQPGSGNQPVQFGGEISQDQKLVQRMTQSTTAAQQIRFEETAPTPEGHISPLTEVMVEVDDDLRIAVKTSGREVMVSMDGSPRAIEEMAGIGPELKDSLKDMGFNLSHFSTKEDDGQPLNSDDNGQSQKSPTKDGSASTTQSNLGPIRQVRRGGQVDTVA
jgi:hypothetical protein